jgi:hypothetical protein
MIGTKSYQYILPSGQWRANKVNGAVYVSGDAILTVTDAIDLKQSGDAVTVASGASLKLYMLGTTANIGGGGVVNETGFPINFQYFGGPNNQEVNILTPQLSGLIYAPNAMLVLGGKFQPSLEMLGAIVAKNMRVQGKFILHFDQSVQSIKSPIFKLASWEER